jgi:hypothetical protein
MFYCIPCNPAYVIDTFRRDLPYLPSLSHNTNNTYIQAILIPRVLSYQEYILPDGLKHIGWSICVLY